MPWWWNRVLNWRLTRWRCSTDLPWRLLVSWRVKDAVRPTWLHWLSWSDYSFRWWSFSELGHQTQIFLVNLGLIVGAFDAAHAWTLGFTIFRNVTGAAWKKQLNVWKSVEFRDKTHRKLNKRCCLSRSVCLGTTSSCGRCFRSSYNERCQFHAKFR